MSLYSASRTLLRGSPLATATSRSFASSAANLRKVALLGAAGGIGQPLSLLLKMNDKISDLALFDVKGTPGVGADIAHVNTKSTVTGLLADNDGLKKSLTGAEVVVVPAGVPRKPGMTRDDLFNTNASIVRDLAKAAAEACPKAHILIISNPVNSTVPIAAEVFKSKNVYDPKRLFGVTTLDVVRSSRFVSEIKGTDPANERVTVIGGHSGATIVPLLSQVQGLKLDDEKRAALVKRIQFGGDEVVKAKDGAGSATLSMAYAAAVFTNSLLRALDGEKGVIEPAYIDVKSDKTVGADADQSVTGGCDFFSLPVELGKNGVEKVHAIGEIDEKDKQVLSGAHEDLKKNISAGIKFAKENP